MSILGTIYGGTTGLLTLSKGLDVISNNVANMNTPGYKRSDLLFRDLFYQYQLTGEANQDFSARKDGNGVKDGGTLTSYSQGDIQQSGNDTDVAIDGNGFFILREDNNTYYSRVGQFKIDDDGYLISSLNDARVAGIDASGQLFDININSLRTNPAKATTEVSFANNLSSGDTEHEITGIEVYDALGDKHKLDLKLTNNSSSTPRSWLLEIKDETGAVVDTGQEIRFQGNGSPETGYNSIAFTFAPSASVSMDLVFSFGEPGTFNGATSFSAGSSSDLALDSQDGYAYGSQTGMSFDRDGIIEITYSNGETAKGDRLALGWMKDLQAAKQVGNGIFVLDAIHLVQIEAANEGIMGEIVGKSVEISNVELSQEFTDLVIVQRGFQVSSQVVSIANEMVQQLLDSAGSRR